MYVSKYVEVEVDVEIEDITKGMSAKEKTELAAELMDGTVPFGWGDGDVERATNIIEQAYIAAKRLPNLPREIADLFWVVHGRAL